MPELFQVGAYWEEGGDVSNHQLQVRNQPAARKA